MSSIDTSKDVQRPAGKGRKLAIAGAAALALTAIGAGAVYSQSGPGWGWGGPGYGHGGYGHDGYGRGWGPGPMREGMPRRGWMMGFGPERMIDFALSSVGATSEQKLKITEIAQSAMNDLRPLRDRRYTMALSSRSC